MELAPALHGASLLLCVVAQAASGWLAHPQISPVLGDRLSEDRRR